MIMHRLFMTAAAMALAGSAMAQPAAAPTAPAPAAAASAPATVNLTPSGNIIDTLKASGQFTVLLKALDANGLTSVLQSAGPLTVLAPDDAAFAALPAGRVDALLRPESSDQLRALLSYHLINAAVPASKIQGAKGPILTVANKNVYVDGTATPPTINGADVVGQATVSNGDIYVLDQVLSSDYTPPAAAAATAAPAAPATSSAPAH
jgi:uncharacterized surface protein with fasciclin (FAS1) repeats